MKHVQKKRNPTDLEITEKLWKNSVLVSLKREEHDLFFVQLHQSLGKKKEKARITSPFVNQWRNHFYMVRLVKYWNSLPRKSVEPPSVHVAWTQQIWYLSEMTYVSFLSCLTADLENLSSPTLLLFFLFIALNVLLPFQDKLCLFKTADRTFVTRTVYSIIQNTE